MVKLAPPKHYYKCFRFMVCLGPWNDWNESSMRLSGDPGLVSLRVSTVESYDTEKLFLGRGVEVGGTSLVDEIGAHRTFSILMLTDKSVGVWRVIEVSCARVEWLPFALDANEDDVAADHVVLHRTTYSEKGEVGATVEQPESCALAAEA